ncbi:serine--tRNA ligase [Malassezia cuniculi]|uniref:serine--tRNA ligase n=1 Tax=Malassezia cuniculi TaxID=948313 RepID=A0AAF0EU93_9BASI|nr:serine--tRNA ligase [Malassezia cuniculi]
MKFSDDEAAELERIQSGLAEMHRETRSLETEQKQVGEQIQRAAKTKETPPEDMERLRNRARELRTRLRDLSQAVSAANSRSLAIRSAWPNRMHASVVHGDENASRVVAVHDRRPQPEHSDDKVNLPLTLGEFDSVVQPRRDANADHLQVAGSLRCGDVDMTAGIITTGPSWPYLVGSVSLLEHALTQYAIATALSHNYMPVSVPDVIKTNVAERCGFRPRDEVAAQTYHVSAGKDDGLCLAGTAEIPLGALMAGQTFRTGAASGACVADLALPIRLVALGHAFRAEAGARGADTRGLYRIHQFTKAEMFAVTDADSSDAMLEELRSIQEEIVSGLELYYRVLDMSSVELGASAYRKYDIEAWMPGRGGWGEVSSASNCTDYQSHRLSIKYRPGEGEKLRYAHTLNATAAAIPRLILAILETHGLKDGKLVLPAALRPYWLGGDVVWTDGAKKTNTALGRAREQLRKLARRTGADPGSLVASFLILHELTAIVPLVILAASFATLGLGATVIDYVERVANDIAPEMLGGRVAHAKVVGERLAWRFGGVSVLADIAAAYMITKLLAPVRIAFSLALAPRFARAAITPVIRGVRRILSHRS